MVSEAEIEQILVGNSWDVDSSLTELVDQVVKRQREINEQQLGQSFQAFKSQNSSLG